MAGAAFKKHFVQFYLKTIKFGHLALVTLLGIWPCYYDYETKTYKTNWYLRFYSVTILASIVALLLNTAVTLHIDITETNPSEYGKDVGFALTGLIVLALVIIYLFQIKNAEQINSVVENGGTLYAEICGAVGKLSSADWVDFLTNFTFYIVFNGSLMCDMTI